MTRLNPIRVLIADDHPMIRTALKSMINTETNMIVVGEAQDGSEAVKLFDDTQPDITLMDLNMPSLNGLEAIRQIRETHTDARIIVLTNFDSDEDVHNGIEAGAMGYVLKDSTQEKLLESIRSVYAGLRFIPRNLAEKLTNRKTYPKLSPRELSVLRLMMMGKSNRAIGVELGITESTVKSHVKNILTKMGVNDRTQAVTRAIQRGILRMAE